MKILFILLSILNSGSAIAADCVLTIHRTACPGKEQEALAPYGGLNPTSMTFINLESSSGCTDEAVMHSKILRKRVIKKISVSPRFDGSDLTAVTSEDLCKTNRRKK